MKLEEGGLHYAKKVSSLLSWSSVKLRNTKAFLITVNSLERLFMLRSAIVKLRIFLQVTPEPQGLFSKVKMAVVERFA